MNRDELARVLFEQFDDRVHQTGDYTFIADYILKQVRKAAEDQRAACALQCEARDNDFAYTYADIVRETPLVTEEK